MSSVLKLYAAPIVLLTWSGLWALGVRGHLVVILFLALAAAAHFVAERERSRLRRRRGC